jgi:hypothetical protein
MSENSRQHSFAIKFFNKYSKEIIKKTPFVKELNEKMEFYNDTCFVDPGHFYSPITNPGEMHSNKKAIFDPNRALNGIDLNLPEQKSLLEEFKELYKRLPFKKEKNKEHRYYYENEFYSYSDVIFLFCMMLKYKPHKIIEIGSGFSSAAMLDINELFFDDKIDLTFIDPYPGVFKSLARKGDSYNLIPEKIQNVDINIFKSLERNDFLFIDSTHIAKTNSDVLFELFEILPSLQPGVKIHVHDIFFPFEYPEDWVLNQNRSWNEIYFLRSFLMYNSAFSIKQFNTCAQVKFEHWFRENMPLCLNNRGGSIWLEKNEA